MKNKFKTIYISIITILVIILISLNIYQYNKIDRFNKDLEYITSYNIQMFASTSFNLDDDISYSQKYGYIVTAQSAYATLAQGKGLNSEEYENSLARLLLEIKLIMLNDREKLERAFNGTDMAELMLKIGRDFQDKESIEKVLELIK